MTSRSLAERFGEVRGCTESLAAPLSAEDQTVQSVPDVSPTKWHRAHTSWFFETFVLQGTAQGGVFDPRFNYLFNSYYEAVGQQFPRAQRGILSRPGIDEIARYRADVDARVVEFLAESCDQVRLDLVELGLHHEQQHQELLLMDIKHVLSQHPEPAPYAPARTERVASAVKVAESFEHEGGTIESGARGDGFCFDNELPRHRVFLEPFSLELRLVSCGEFLEFIEDGGYERPELWLSEGWATLRQRSWRAPLYWSKDEAQWHRFTLFGREPLCEDDPVTHLSYFEADAFARWRDARLPTEAEWEVVAESSAAPGHFALEPPSVNEGTGFFGSAWQWTQSSYSPYPGFRAAPGAVGEYNGKFMVNQQVLRGGASITPEGHTRASYRNFFPADSRWPYTGLRLARDAK